MAAPVSTRRLLLTEQQVLTTNKGAVEAHINTLPRSEAAVGIKRSWHRGIVYPTGGAKQLINTWVSLKILRDELHCDLPVELIYFGPKEMPNGIRHILQASLFFWLDITQCMSLSIRRIESCQG